MAVEDSERPWRPGIHAAVGFGSHCSIADSVIFVAVAVVARGIHDVAVPVAVAVAAAVAAAAVAAARIRLARNSFLGFGSWHSDCPWSRDSR